jgi:hypothetical protein
MSIENLVRQKTEKATGGNVNYYLIEVKSRLKAGAAAYVAEVEDIIEYFNMEFCEGNVFKALVRLTKLRQDLGKPGSSKTYEAEKIVYYSKRIVAQVERKIDKENGSADQAALATLPNSFFIEHPKRLTPYTVNIDDLVESLDPTENERIALKALLIMCQIRKVGLQAKTMHALAIACQDAAEKILQEN